MNVFALLTAFVIASVVGHCAAPTVSEAEAVAAAKKSWQSVLAASPNKKKFSTDADYWYPVFDVATAEAKSLFAAEHRAARIKFFVDQFGSHGGEADFRWMLTDLWMTLPQRGSFSPSDKQFSPDDRDRYLVFCEALVRRLLADPKLLDRYYRFVVWSQSYFRPSDPDGDAVTAVRWGIVRQEFNKHKEPPDYWWLARDVLLLAVATGNTELLKEAKPEELRGVFEKLDEWLDENQHYLMLHKTEPRWTISETARKLGVPRKEPWPALAPPERPFADWPEKLPPPDASFLLKLE